ncbi:MAG: filamentous hemagglutinin N-terminal domain-containing protein [Elainella sp. C42_A2020_010]|nr:filamentous hemagglutinin N-terminal domain-containing protein [Elainella sp. C42_A2020_010]
MQRVVWAGLASLAVSVLGMEAEAQVVPDNTLGAASSQVRADRIRGRDGIERDSDVIEGGAQRGANLFHSFQQFDVPEGRGAYFGNPADVQNIFSRVTGADRSEILGTLGVFGNANLYFMNPNGILFGPNASLDVGGSFAVTTANAIQFGELGFFSATNPEVPSQVLTVNPSAFLFNQIAAQNPPNITNQANVDFGLRVPNGENLLLLGGNVVNEGGDLNAFEGRIEIGAVRGVGTLGLNSDGSLSFPTDVQRGDVVFTNAARATVTAEQRQDGNIEITARRIAFTERSTLQIGVFNPQDRIFLEQRQAGDIVLDATEQIFVAQDSTIENVVAAGAFGNGGSININTPTLEVRDGARLSATSSGRGDAGNVVITATGSIIFQGTGSIDPSSRSTHRSSASTEVFRNGNGNAGNITIETPILEVLDGAGLIANNNGQGNAGDITIDGNRVTFQGVGGIDAVNNKLPFSSDALSSISRGSIGSEGNRGSEGNIRIDTSILEVLDGARLTTSTFARGSAGSITIEATERATFRGTGGTEDNGQPRGSGVLSEVAEGGGDDGGNIEITTPILEVLDGAQINAQTSGMGNAGNILVQGAQTITLNDAAKILTAVNRGGIGSGGNINLNTHSLTLTNGAQLTASTLGRGNAGNIYIQAETVILDRNSTISTALNVGAISISPIGRRGRIILNANTLSLDNRSNITSSTFGVGDAGNITINASDRINLRNRSRITNRVQQGATGNSQTIRLTTPQLSLRGNSRLSAATNGIGQAGNVIVQNADSIFLGNSTISTQIGATGIVPRLANQPNRSQPADQRSNILLDTNSLTLNNGARITANTANQGDAGNITVRDAETISLNQSTISSAVGENASGQGGNIQLNTNNLNLDNARISARTQAQGRGGDIVVNAEDTIQTTDSDIETLSDSSSSGDINLSAAQIRLRGDSDIRTQVNQGDGSGGNITLSADAIVAFDDSDIVTRAPEGQGGNIRFDTPAFFGEAYIPDTRAAENSQVEVDASGVRSGVVTAPDVSFIQNSLADLPTSAINTDQLLANSCIARTETGGTFLITGTGGLPAAPGNDAASAYPTGEVRAIPTEEAPTDWQPGDPIVEPQGVYRLPDGRLVMSRDCFDQQAK